MRIAGFALAIFLISSAARAHGPGVGTPSCKPSCSNCWGALKGCLTYPFSSSSSGPSRVKLMVGGIEATFRNHTLYYFTLPDGTNGPLQRGHLANQHDLSCGDRRIRFMPGAVSFHRNGSVARGCLASRTDFPLRDSAITLEPQCVSLYASGRLELFSLTREAELPFRGGRTRFEPGPMALHESGSVREGTIATDTEIVAAGRTFTVGKIHHAIFHEDGMIERIYVKPQYRDRRIVARYGGRDLPFHILWLHPSGRLRKSFLAENAEFTVGPNRLLASAITPNYFENREILSLDSTPSVSFFDDERIESVHIAGEPVITAHGTRMRVKDGIEFFRNGSVRSTTLAERVSLPLGGGRRASFAWNRVVFYPNGAVREGHVDSTSAVVINGRSVTFTEKSSARTLFHPDGTVHSTDTFNKKYRSWGFTYPAIYADFSKGIVEAEGNFHHTGEPISLTEFGRDKTETPIVITLPRSLRCYYWIRYVHPGGKRLADAIQVSEDTVIDINGRKVPATAFTWVKLKP
ncbi:MAG TPA: hypothetical protein PLG31_08410 [Spirochaetota bacterium]|nr:hypothetical protein [Spirochaetota bacterium]